MSRGGHQYGRVHLPVESCHSLSSWGYFQRAQMWTEDEDELEFSWDGDDKRAVIHFTRNEHKHTQELVLTFTPCNYGGWRAWFVCPNCGRRVGKVYLPCTMYAGDMRVWWWRCRRCFDLTYEQRRERAPYWSTIHRIERLEERWFGEITDNFIYRRKGQHWATFNKRFEEREALVGRENAAGWAGLEGLKKYLSKSKSKTQL